jgi:hypothetical protein
LTDIPIYAIIPIRLYPYESRIMKIKERLVEKRRYIRLKTPIPLTYIVPDSGNTCNSVTKDISADGLRFETTEKSLKEGSVIEFKLALPGANNPIHAKGRIVWKRRLSLEDNAPYDLGVEFVEIEEDNKNTFLKFLCDLIYNLPKET